MEAKKIERDELGLIKGVKYVFNSDGLIDWRKMVRSEFLVPNRQRTTETDISKLDDAELLIKLGGLKDLAQIRGFDHLTYKLLAASENYVAVACQIKWKPNYETEGNSVVFESLADAHSGNTEDFARIYLAAIAENRAFARCVRNFLRINIVAQEEVSSKSAGSGPAATDNQKDLCSVLDNLLERKKIQFQTLKNRLISENIDGAEEFESTRDIPKNLLFDLILRLTKVKEKA